MFPLSYLLIAWMVLVGIFLLFSLITIAVHLRYGLTGFMTSITAALFWAVTIAVLLSVSLAFTGVDWTQSVGFGVSQSDGLSL